MSAPLPHRHAEQITATVLFADLVGFFRLSNRCGTETAYGAVTHLLRLLDGIARKHGGSVDKYLGDKLMAVFGHPLPLQQPGRAAARAALEMRQRVHEYNRESDSEAPLGIHIGINTGELVSGDIRGPVVREFHVLGDAVNVAARINARAPDDQIWVGASVHDGLEDEFHWKALEPLLFKGKSRPVEIWALEASRGPSVTDRLGHDELHLTDLVGRGSELSRLRERVRALAAGRGGLVRVVGAAGAGKSRLIGALGEAEEVREVAVLQLHASAIDRERALATLAPLLDEAARSAASGPREGDAPAPEAVSRRLAERLRARAQQRPLLLVIEDRQWMDAASAAVLDQLLPLGEQAPLLFLLSERPGSDAIAALGAGSERAFDETIELGALSKQEARALVVAALGDGVDAETIELVLSRGGDLPGSILRAAFLAPVLRSEREQQARREERASEAERRRAAVLFADLTGFTAMTEQVGAEQTYSVVAACLEILDRVAREHGGTVDHYLGDCVMALFGVPRAIEDAPRAALNAAIEMRRQIRAFSAAHDLPVPIDLHTGVATGLGIAGDISGPLIREFAVMGDHVDRADVLTHRAEAGDIRADDATWRATRDVFRFAEAEALLLPGAAAPQLTYALLSETPVLHRRQVGAGRRVFSELVGREEQLGALREALAALAMGRGGVVSLSAEAGLGKSRLMTEVRSSGEATAASWLVGRALSNGRNLRYHPIADLLRTWSGIHDSDDEATARRKLDETVASVLPGEAEQMAPLLANVMGAVMSAEERERIASIQGDAAEKIVRAALLQLLRAAAARRPIVIVLEDLHWADLSTIELVESIQVLAAEHPLLFVFAFRPGFEETSGRVLAHCREQLAGRLVELELAPLDAAAARSMVKNLFRGGDVPRQTRRSIEERARGNPFYIEEVVRNLVDTGAVEVHEGAFRATEKLATVVIPDTVQEAVMARVDRLDLARRSVLQAASVIGGTFHLDVLEEMSEAPDLKELLDELEESEFIVPSDRTAGVEYAFKHPLIQEVTYDSLLETRRRQLHLAVARATEERLSESMPSYCAMLAFHFSKAQDAERAEEYLFRAGDEASRSAASNEALHFFQQASALYDQLHGGGGDSRKRARLEKSLAAALMNRGRLIESVDHFDAAVNLLGGSSPRGTVRMGLGFAADLFRVLGRLYLGRPYGRRPASDDERELIGVMFRRAMAQSTTSPTRFFVDSTALIRTLSPLDPLSVPESAAIFSGVVAIFSFGGISFGIGRRFLDVARELADAGAVDERVLYYRTLRFLHHLLEGDWSDAHSIEPELVEEGIREGRFWEASTYLDLDCHRQVYQGNFDAAWERIAQLAELVDLYENDLARSAQLAHTAFVHVERREFDAALRALDLYYDEHEEILFNIVALGTRARVSALRGRLEAAEEEASRAESLMRQAGRVAPLHASYVHSSRFLLDVLTAERALEAGEAPSRKTLRRLRRSRRAALATARNVAWRRTEGLRLAGREAWLRGQPAEAVSWWQRALDCGSQLGARPELGRTWADAGGALARADAARTLQGRDAGACLQEARHIFDALGLSADRECLPRSA